MSEFNGKDKLRIAGTVNDSIVDGEGYRYAIFTQGCPHACPGCHNPQTHNFRGGRLVKLEELLQEALLNPLLSGVTFSGGEPFCQAAVLAELGREFHRHQLDIWCYTGYTYEQLRDNPDPGIQELLQLVDVLVDGPFVEEQRDLTLSFRGSSNQRLIDMPQTRARGRVVLYEQDEY